MSEGTIDIEIPEEVLNGKEFAFTYDALITNNDLKEFTNNASFDFLKTKSRAILIMKDVLSILMLVVVFPKSTCFLNINKVVAVH